MTKFNLVLYHLKKIDSDFYVLQTAQHTIITNNVHNVRIKILGDEVHL